MSKGSRNRVTNRKAWDENFDQIRFPSIRCAVCNRRIEHPHINHTVDPRERTICDYCRNTTGIETSS